MSLNNYRRRSRILALATWDRATRSGAGLGYSPPRHERDYLKYEIAFEV